MMVNNVNTPFSPQELKVAELLACGLSEKGNSRGVVYLPGYCQ